MLEENKLSIQQPKQRGGIAFPLDYEDASALKQSFLTVVQVQLQNGTSTIYDSKILASSIGFANHSVFSGIIGVLSVQCSNGSATITSSSDTDNSLVNVLIIY
ncbi:MAG: hypothetical protein KatS3mg096_740 [Candidatus Parcubacteria bacterium]|nr:MAG: hypothetical protein KatS3mg096_740 [Candidatus Parcubacteria bacterium]